MAGGCATALGVSLVAILCSCLGRATATEDVRTTLLFQGKVTDPEGEPIDKAQIDVSATLLGIDVSKRLWRVQLTSGLDGTFEIMVNADGWDPERVHLAIEASHREFVPAVPEHTSLAKLQETQLKVGSSSPCVLLALRQGEPLTGAILDAQGQQVEDAKIVLTTKSPNQEWISQERISDSHGRFSAQVPPSSDGIIWIKHDEYAVNGRRIGTRRDWDIVLQPGHSVCGKLVGIDGRPVSHVELHIRRDDTRDNVDTFLRENRLATEFRRIATSDNGGVFRFAPLPDGPYRIVFPGVHRSEQESIFASHTLRIRDADTDSHVQVELRAEPTMLIHATLKTLDGEPRIGESLMLSGTLRGHHFHCRSTAAQTDSNLWFRVPISLRNASIYYGRGAKIRWRRNSKNDFVNSRSVALELGQVKSDMDRIDVRR